ncbi:hypothetical protein SNOG_07884 [Parastagonospora nodorum SN15]|uniref:Uncharacterized protein n=1 Tax=Phaeosphaeria nodorum (strain SN15 / ATCC MYA-4574 / FGSC 10173) TaxID=321614 RepID=Q0UK30_PHANO|nr:hypothetical protein SNOG_07884 [Parastagonospora nodorum SN15]EAT84160.1 hypothetical protein SNOG_07884 [Parastagonospora nodorum SN15]
MEETVGDQYSLEGARSESWQELAPNERSISGGLGYLSSSNIRGSASRRAASTDARSYFSMPVNTQKYHQVEYPYEDQRSWAVKEQQEQKLQQSWR